MARPIFTARFSHVAIAAFAADPANVLKAMGELPDGLELDTPSFNATPELASALPPGSAIVSLVAAEVENARMWGVGIPGQSSYSELALRVHVRATDSRQAGLSAAEDRRGVFPIRRLVSRRLVCGAFTRFLGERCLLQHVTGEFTQQARTIHASFRLKFSPPMLIPGPGEHARPDGQSGTYTLSLYAAKPWTRADPTGVDAYLKEPRLVYSRLAVAGRGAGARAPKAGQAGDVAMVQRVLHPRWSIFPVTAVETDVDFGNVFGADWGFLTQIRPFRGVLAVGSDVAFFPRQPIVRVVEGIGGRALEPAPAPKRMSSGRRG